MFGWKKDGDKHLRGVWGAGSQSTKKRQVKKGKQFQEQASQSYNLGAMIEREKAIAVVQTENIASNVPIPAACDPPVSH